MVKKQAVLERAGAAPIAPPVRKRWRRPKKGTGASASAVAPVKPFRVEPLQTGTGARNKWLDRFGWYEPLPAPILSTTRQAEALRLGVASRSGSERALVMCQDLESGQEIYSDPKSDYAMEDGPRSPTRLLVGDVSFGKSTFLKCNAVVRPLLVGRRVVVLDKKLQRDEDSRQGEYGPVCKLLGVEPLRFATDGTGMRINALDPRIVTTGGTTQGPGQTVLLRAILLEALGRPISELEGKALRMAHAQAVGVARNEGYVADVRHVVEALKRPDVEAAKQEMVKRGQLREWGLEAQFALERCVEEDLAGLIDGPTDPRVQVNPTLTSFDLSTLPDTGPALKIVMAIVSTWLGSILSTQRVQVPTHFVVEEGWHLTEGSFGEVARRNTKLARGTGLINEFAFHHLSDVPPGSPAMAMIKEAGTAAFYRQSKDEDAAAVIREFSLPPDMSMTLKGLEKGVFALWQGTRPLRMVQLIRSDIEAMVADTDSAMLSQATTFDLLDRIGEMDGVD